jgi:hypothetical protein
MKSLLPTLSSVLVISTAINGQTCNYNTEITVNGPCSHGSLTAALSGCTLDKDQVEAECNSVGYGFSNISSLYYQFDKEYMDGGSLWNDAEAGMAEVEAIAQGDRIVRVSNNVLSSQRVSWPEYDALDPFLGYYVLNNADRAAGVEPQPSYMDNFNLTDSCDIGGTSGVGAVVCCFTGDSTEADGFVSDADDNSDVCTHDLHDSHKSSHLYRGHAVYDDSAKTHCTGFAFDAANDDSNNQYRANLLAHTSFLNTVSRGLRGNVPGAPMCGCLEKMPTITDAACTKVDVSNERFKVTPNSDGTVSVNEDYGTSVRFSDCGSSLKTYIENEYSQVSQAALDGHLAGDGNCDAVRHEARNNDVWAEGQPTDPEIDDLEWEQVAGFGSLYYPYKNLREDYDDIDDEFRAKLSDPPFIIRRVCPSCAASHRDIYYKRLTPVPLVKNVTQDGQLVEVKYNFLYNFLDSWYKEPSNLLNTDFTLHSTYDDAVEGTNGWTYCNYNHHSVGFPRDCGPTGGVGHQWNAYTIRNPSNTRYNGYDNGYYIEKTAGNVNTKVTT